MLNSQKNTYHFLSQEIIDKFLIDLMKKHKVLTVGYAIINNGEIKNSNTISILEDIEVTTNSLFQACSFSKSLTAFGILVLKTQNKIDIDIPINSQLQSWKIPENKCHHSEDINIRQCLSMTSGLCYGDPNPIIPPYTQDKPIPTTKDILNGQVPALNKPINLGFSSGTEYHYSGAGYMVLQQLIEEKAQQSFVNFMDQVVLKPLKMTHSFFQQPLSEKLKSKVVPGYDNEGIMVKEGWDNIPTLASGGLWSTPLDIANFILYVTNTYLGKINSIISNENAIEMLRLQKNSIFGLGVVVEGEGINLNFRKNGHNRGYHNEFIMFPNSGNGLVVMTNSANGMELIKSFTAFVAHHFKWQSYSLLFDENKIFQNIRCRL